jgi:hypothetical protein
MFGTPCCNPLIYMPPPVSKIMQTFNFFVKFYLEFEVNLVVIFDDDRLITENFPIKLTRY